MNLKIYEDSRNYTCQVIKLPTMQKVDGLDNLVKVNVQGNDCLISKDSDHDELYLFFPVECELSHKYISDNNLYRHNDLNLDITKKGFFEDNRRVKAVKFKGVISSGFVIPIKSLPEFVNDLKLGDEFNEIDGIEICKKYVKKFNVPGTPGEKKVRTIDEIVDSRMAPEHPDTEHLLKNAHKLKLSDTVVLSYKLHGTSARYYNTLVKRKLSLLERFLGKVGISIQKDEYHFISASRRVLKSIDFEELSGKLHYYSEDLWTKVGKEYFDGKLNKGEAVYCEIIGKDYTGAAIQSGYTYGLEKPEVYIYRISNINTQGIEIDLPYKQMIERAEQLGLKSCPCLFYGKLDDFILRYIGRNDPHTIEEELDEIFNNILLEKPSILDSSVVEEGFCLRVDNKYPKPDIYKIKSKKFLLHEGALLDKEVLDIEVQQT